MAGLDDLATGGAPLLGEPLPIELANTRYAARGDPRDGIETATQLGAWLRDTRSRFRMTFADDDLLKVSRADLDVARRLRDAVHDLLTAVVAGESPPGAALEAVNQVARAVPRWAQLRWGEPPTVESGTRGRPVVAASAEIAEAAIDLLAGPHRALIRVCRAPGCVLFFLKNHPRRTWCSEACGNRARVARFYARRLALGEDANDPP